MKKVASCKFTMSNMGLSDYIFKNVVAIGSNNKTNSTVQQYFFKVTFFNLQNLKKKVKWL